MKTSIFKKLWNKIKAFFNRIFKVENNIAEEEKVLSQNTRSDDFLFTGEGKILIEDIVELNNSDRDYTNILLYDDMTIINPSHSTEAIIENTVETGITIIDLDKIKEDFPPKINVTEEIFDKDFTVTDVILSNIGVDKFNKEFESQLIVLYREGTQLYFKLALQSPTRERTIIEKVNVINKSAKDLTKTASKIGGMTMILVGEERKYGYSI